MASKLRDPPDLNLSCWGGTCLAQCRQYFHAAGKRRVSRNVRWHTVLLQSLLVALSSVLRVHYDKIVVMPLVALSSLCAKSHKILWMHSVVTSKNESWPRLIWNTLYLTFHYR